MAFNDRFAMRIGANYAKRDGLYYNELTDQELLNQNSTNVRLSALALITDNWEMTLLVEGIDASNNDAVVADPDAFAEVVRLNRAPAGRAAP